MLRATTHTCYYSKKNTDINPQPETLTNISKVYNISKI